MKEVVVMDKKNLLRDLYAQTSLDEEACQTFIRRLDVNNDGQERLALTASQVEEYLYKHTTMHRRCCREAAEGLFTSLEVSSESING